MLDQLRLLKGLILPLIVVAFAFVLGSIYSGIALVTEASAVGVAGVILSTVIRRDFSWKMAHDASLLPFIAMQIPGGRHPHRLPGTIGR